MPERSYPARERGALHPGSRVYTHEKILIPARIKTVSRTCGSTPPGAVRRSLSRAVSVKAGCAELLYAYIDVEPVSFNRGFYTVDVRYFYRITADAFVGAARPVEISGLAVFDKRVILFGSEGSAKVFSSQGQEKALDVQNLPTRSLPTAVVESVDPIALHLKLVDPSDCCVCPCGEGREIPADITARFGEALVTSDTGRRLYVTLGQFSIIRLERDTQLLIPAYDYCVPEKDCQCSTQDDPCTVFSQIRFPIEEFFPPDSGDLADSSAASSSSASAS